MIHLRSTLGLSILLAMFCGRTATAGPKDVRPSETRYLTFQVMTGLPGYAGPPPRAGRFSLDRGQMKAFVGEIAHAIGTTGDARDKLAFAVGPLCFDMPDDETRQFIHEAFAVARENDVAVAFHIDDSMVWGRRKDLLSNPDNIETAGWDEKPNTGRRADWGPEPTRFPPQMCFNSPAIVNAVRARGRLIGEQIRREVKILEVQGKKHLFAGVIAGWETQIGRDFETGRPLGFRGLAHRGFSASHPPKEIDRERTQIVHEFIRLWADSLQAGGIARNKVFCHIAFTDQGLRPPDAQESYAVKVNFAVPEVAFDSRYRPGFSTYPEGETFQAIYDIVRKHGNPGWISAEGANISPTGMPGEPTMETYLSRMFDHGAVLVNIFAWGIGGEAMKDNFFRRAAENPEALAAYAKFLRHEKLAVSAPTGFSPREFRAKMQRIQAELPAWVQKSGKQAEAMPLVQKLQALLKQRKWLEADRVADEMLSLIKNNPIVR